MVTETVSRSGFKSNLTSQQKETLDSFRKALHDDGILHDGDTIGTDDAALLRYLRARKFDLPKSKALFAKAQAWRKDPCGEGLTIDQLYVRMDPFDFDKRTEIMQYWPMFFHGVDREGRPLNIQAFGNFDVAKLQAVETPEYHWKSVCLNAESLTREVLPASVKAAGGRDLDGNVSIVDLKGFTLGQFWQVKALAKRSFGLAQDYYPEGLGRLYIVNAPSSFTYVWGVMKPWLSKETQEKVNILGTDYASTLLKYIDAEQLPSTLGGACNCKEGCSLSSRGPWLEGRAERRRADIARFAPELAEDSKADEKIDAIPNGHADTALAKTTSPDDFAVAAEPSQTTLDQARNDDTAHGGADMRFAGLRYLYDVHLDNRQRIVVTL
ncbi:uncharacterized protein L969DRAFT_42362 [Mixia osmundae IAM 14324]|uniref:CRAL-TRIO domain-containing protein n=1 Tax=Mixia osmundae (strain CBS 9802 / IAM 14324 / JCM 22182 / KY 12970) TaxID=764103 RepID=G7E080_MIXOS|nr:uncharacterized protein L969DRAFT_42362 [Mixia osmundae IAM 14324]KEI42230.1 hypothetical protein L969DRAFT_42362 [Mixia osmundae IAM 14324]GAA96240.1 hypothetical protein E5Q_02904 [Mixia osmundae IAM 14324]